MKKKLLKFMFVSTVCLGLIFPNGVLAATANISANNTNVNVGDTVTVTVSTEAGAWNLAINGGGLSSSDTSGLVGQTNTTSNSKATKTYTFTADKAGKFTVGLSGDITDYDTDEKSNISKSVTINVTEPAPAPAPEPTPTPSNNDAGKNGEQNNNPPANNGGGTDNGQTPKTGNEGDTNNTGKGTSDNNNPTPSQPTEPKFTDANETMYVDYETVNVREGYTTSTKLLGTLKKGDKITRIGVGENGWSKVSYNGQTAYILSKALTTKAPEGTQEEEKNEDEKPEEEKNEEKSSDKALKELEVEGYTLSPEFNPETTRYSLTLNEKDEKLNIKATPQSEKATVNISGNDKFSLGNNIVKIEVTAEDGTTRLYTIAVSKPNAEGVVELLKLKNLQVANAVLSPSFDPEVTSYVIKTDDPSSIKAEDVVATAEDTNVKVTVAENTDTSKGEKTITIMLENSDRSKSGIYQITVKKPENIQAMTNVKGMDNSLYYILGAVVLVLVLLIVFVIILLRKSKNEEEYDDELEDDYDVEDEDDRTQVVGTEYNVFKDDGNDEDEEFEDDEVEPETKVEQKDEIEENADEDEDNKNIQKKGKHF